jgi:hypothetical protein
MGNIGHGRKQFLEILHAFEIWLDTKAAKYLTTPLVSISLPPHFSVSVDKSTVYRVTNQAIVVSPMFDGKRQAIPVQAPSVYDLEDVDDGITEAIADKLADNVYDRGGSRIFRTSVKIFLADGALSALGVVSTGCGRLQA